VAEKRISLESGWKIEIAGLVINVHYRRLNFAKKLIKNIENWALEEKISILRVRSDTKREASHHFYESVGFSLNNTSNLYKKVVFDS
jgi:GNAT superfamily N-acetyltransferase